MKHLPVLQELSTQSQHCRKNHHIFDSKCNCNVKNVHDDSISKHQVIYSNNHWNSSHGFDQLALKIFIWMHWATLSSLNSAVLKASTPHISYGD